MGHNRVRPKVKRRKVAELATYSRKYTVNNCTIPKVDKNLLIEDTSTWNKDRILLYTKDTAVWNADKWYKEQRNAALKTIKENKTYKYKGKRKPWYVLDSRKTRHYEERKQSYGNRIDYFRVPSEASMMYNKTVYHLNNGSAWYMEQLVQHKLARWERKNPCPVKEDQNPPDIFEQEYVVPWKAKREIALERIRDFVVSMYDNLPLIGRFKTQNGMFVEEQITNIKDVNMEGHKINELNPKTSKLLKIAKKTTDNIKEKNKNLVCTRLMDHKHKKGRIILPNAA